LGVALTRSNVLFKRTRHRTTAGRASWGEVLGTKCGGAWPRSSRQQPPS
jgi:hypothetical protein